jgi:transcription initiation factor TFIIH subunit 2
MTGAPSGVGWFMKPSGLLEHGDVVEIEIDRIGTIKNQMVFDNTAEPFCNHTVGTAQN